ncbi:MAG: diguanylate cyclase [Limnochordia bacterium]|jgi:diguanylate cyclase (GGDEF)-like protein
METVRQARRSSSMIIITLLLLVLIGVTGMYAGHTYLAMRDDAEVVNKLGFIRGLVQRVVHLEMMGLADERHVEDLERRLLEFSQVGALHPVWPRLWSCWQDFKAHLLYYREVPSETNLQALFRRAETFWVVSNETVLYAQQLAEAKLRQYVFILASFIIIWLLTGLILIWLKRYVRDSLEYLAHYDDLTRAANKSLYTQVLEEECQRALRYDRPLSLLILDIDRFKRVNDTYGHSVGDLVLGQLAAVVQRNIRGSDLLARVGGEEFAVIAPETDLEQAKALAERLRLAVASASFPKVGSVTISIGLSQFQREDTPDELFRRADVALYLAKERGRNRVEIQN